ncbi:hypothetical protein DSO57_1014019 [Entomophthora muscae]|uniref:Uncharacterized protein n=1 Tax=Entomophthora muscae TaxID=34485 RepID=A0ACC2T5H0_9FUNG|nr:hypothetical protein DSO57_1014019 [Entomophthora muscae]
MTMDQQLARLEEILGSISSPSNTSDSIKAATTALCDFTQKPESLPLFIKVIGASSHLSSSPVGSS